MPQAIKDKQIIFIPINKDLLIPAAAASFPMMKWMNIYWMIDKIWHQGQLTAKSCFVDAAVTVKAASAEDLHPRRVDFFIESFWVCFCECTLDYPVKQITNEEC